MPKLGKQNTFTREIEACRQAWQAFEAGFRLSRRGNLWQTWGDSTISVFQRSDGLYGWCIAGASDEEADYSDKTFSTEAEALDALGQVLGIGEL